MGLRYEKSGNPFKVGDHVQAFIGGRTFFGRVVDLLDFEGSGLVMEDGILVCEDFNGTPWPHAVGWGAVKAVR